MKKSYMILLGAVLLVLTALLAFYFVSHGTVPQPDTSPEEVLELVPAAEAAWQNQSATVIRLSDDGTTASSGGVEIQGKQITITQPGIYSLSGELTEGQVAVDSKGAVTLILDDAAITNSTDAPLFVSNASHALIYLPEGTSSSLISGTVQELSASAEDAAGAALYAKDSLTLAGMGALTVEGYLNNAIATTDDLTVLSGQLNLTAVNNGLKGKDSVIIEDGTISITCGNDGIKSNEDSDAALGTVCIRGGEITITSLGDGISAETDLTIEGGTIQITAGDTEQRTEAPQSFENAAPMPSEMETPPEIPTGESPPEPPEMPNGENPPEPPEGNPGENDAFHGNREGGRPDFQNGFEPPERPEGDRFDRGDFDPNSEQTPPDFGSRDKTFGDRGDAIDRDQSSDSDASTKGIKCGGDLTISGGSITVNSEDDSIHSNGDLTVTGGTLLLSSGDDGLHADATLTVTDGEITVTQSYEGLEGHLIFLSGGTISVTARDDGINASGSADTSLPTLSITGGTLIVNADGDGLDSNGDLIVEGGTIIVDGPTNSANGALDSGTENGGRILCSGGTVLAIGASGMAETFGTESAQCSFIQTLSQTMEAGTEITITDENGTVIFRYQSAKTFNSVVFSSPELTVGSTCTLTVGDQTETIALDSISNGSSFSAHGR